MKSQRKVWVSPELKAQINAYWRPRTEFSSESDFARAVIEDIGMAVIDEENELADHDSNGTASVRVWIEDADWARAQSRAAASGLSVHSVIRRRIIHLIEGT